MPLTSTSTSCPTSAWKVSFISSRTPDDLYEKTYEVGGRYYRTYRKLSPYAKVMYGRGVFNFPALSDGFRPNLAYNLVGRRRRRRLQGEALSLRPRRLGIPDLVRLPELQSFAQHPHPRRGLPLPIKIAFRYKNKAPVNAGAFQIKRIRSD